MSDTRKARPNGLVAWFCIVGCLPALTLVMVLGILILRALGGRFDAARDVVAVTDQLWPLQIVLACFGIAFSVFQVRPRGLQWVCAVGSLVSIPLTVAAFVFTHFAIILTCTGW